ncbi:MAG TPA: TIGR02266 family protein [Polyangiales bacterium]|jgi:type IV pilus assembly protein PilZ|nr:TIGR02266 family protein [Polyangiales bacterium]
MNPKSDKPSTQQDDSSELSGAERREHQRFDTSIAVDYASGDTFLFAYLQNISEMGIFIRTERPQSVGTRLRLRFASGDGEPFTLEGEVTWINPWRESGDNLNPGMGVRFIELTPDKREQVVSLVRTVAYLHKDEETPEA